MFSWWLPRVIPFCNHDQSILTQKLWHDDFGNHRFTLFFILILTLRQLQKWFKARKLGKEILILETRVRFLIQQVETKALSHSFNLIQDGRGRGGKKVLPTIFSPVTSTKLGISSPNILTFSFNFFATLA